MSKLKKTWDFLKMFKWFEDWRWMSLSICDKALMDILIFLAVLQGIFCVCVFVCFILQADVISKLNMTDR